MICRHILWNFLLWIPAIAQETKYYVPESYRFDSDAATSKNCVEARQAQGADEQFRLYCVNKSRSWKLCSIECSKAMEMEGTTALCESHRCDFYSQSFETNGQSTIEMNDLAPGKVTFFAMVPMWAAQGQYFYELMEEVRKLYPQNTEALVLPIEVHDWDRPQEKPILSPVSEAAVHILPEISPREILQHSFFQHFVRKLSPRTGNPTFDIFTDRPVIFAVSSEGRQVERFVAPTLAKLEEFIQTHSTGNVQRVSVKEL